MSQNDFTIANQTFPNTRADINSALQALASTSSGSSAPSTTFANQLFYNTSSNLLQIRNEANDAFITIAELDQTNDTVEYVKSDSVRTALIEFTDGDDALAIADGGALTVSTSLDMNGTELILDADADTSITADTDDQIDFKIGATDRVVLTPTKIQLKSSGNAELELQAGASDSDNSLKYLNSAGARRGFISYDTDNDFMFFGAADAEKIRISGSGLSVNTTGTVSSTGSWTGSGDVKFHTTSPSLNLGAFGVVVSHTYRGVFFTNSLWNVYDESNVGVHLVGGNTSWTANSDERIKENIAELNGSDAYNHVKAARAVTFNWKQEAHNAKAGKKIGFIAQDWETNYPELVEETLASPQIVEEIDGIEDDTKIKGIQYTETVPVLMAALKEAIAKIEVLEAKVTALESE